MKEICTVGVGVVQIGCYYKYYQGRLGEVKYVSMRDGGDGQATLTVEVRGLAPSACITMAFGHEV